MEGKRESGGVQCVLGKCTVHSKLSSLLDATDVTIGYIQTSEAMLAAARDSQAVFDSLLAFIRSKTVDELKELVPKYCLVLYRVGSIEELFEKVVQCRKKLMHLAEYDAPPACQMEGLSFESMDRVFALDRAIEAGEGRRIVIGGIG